MAGQGVLPVNELEQTIPFDVQLPYETEDGEGGGMGIAAILNLQQGGETIPPHWSRARDLALVEFVRRTDPLKIAVNTFISKSCTVPLLIQPLDESIMAHVALADSLTKALMENSGLRKGFYTEFRKFLLDYLTTDNGAFCYVMGLGPASGPIVGRATGILHLDSGRCTRTSNPEFPVVYLHTDNKKYRMHYTRVIAMANLPDPRPEMNGVGFCPVSLCLDSARELLDIAVYMQEKLGSRPARRILYAKQGATVEQMHTAIAVYEERLSNQGFKRFAKTLILAPKLPGGKLELDSLDLASTPDGFDRQSVTLLCMAHVAASFGLDLRDMSYSFGISGQTKADAEVQHIKGLGKGVAEFTDNFARELSARFLPEYLSANFNFIDDSQDEQAARIKSLRSTARTRDIMGGVMTVRTARIQMLRENEVTRAEFDEMELEDGRLPDGTDLNSLFFSADVDYSSVLAFSEDDPTDVNGNDPEAVGTEIRENLQTAWVKLETVTAPKTRKKTRQAIAALLRLEQVYQQAVEMQQAQDMQQQQMQMQQQVVDAKVAGPVGGVGGGKVTPAQKGGAVSGNATKKGLPGAKAPEQGGSAKQGQAKAGGQNGNKGVPTQKGKIRNKTRATTIRA